MNHGRNSCELERGMSRVGVVIIFPLTNIDTSTSQRSELLDGVRVGT
jgi:hypothetical protein